ncbi:hypothetical protein CISIN_1g045730mg [Citrus sinensis]|uniref:Uncharacterized protein n=1 Tax=Citrus sinensis TaxID=2711 RepID=A0A067D3Q4_CITSI|nr:hypothetical protein CISIN_1g045730mg [Citrus sinensis]
MKLCCVVNLETEEEERKIEARKFWEWERGFLPLFIISSSTLGTVLDFFSSISGKSWRGDVCKRQGSMRYP